MKNLRVFFKGKEYILLHQYASGHCEIVKEGELNHQVILVHFSELKLKTNE